MARTNGKSQFEEQQIDVEHELPSAEAEENQQPRSADPVPIDHISEVEKLRAERDVLVDRMARMQAEFDNARKRATKEQQDYRDYAMVDTIKTLLPVLDSFDRALQSSPEKSEFHAGVDANP